MKTCLMTASMLVSISMTTQKTAFKLLAILFFIALPGVLFIFLEGSFRLLNMGMDTSPLIKHPLAPGMLVENPDFYKKYYPSTASAPEENANPILLSEEKPEGVKRGFVLGESTPQGFPFNSNQGFVKMAEAGLNLAARKPVVEIVNLAKTAMSSYYVRDAALKLLDFNPDFLIIYVGHNEYYGNMGEASGGNHFARLFNLFLKESRVFQLLFAALDGLNPPPVDRTLMARQFAETEFPMDKDSEGRVLANFLDNLDNAVAAYRARNIPVFLMTPVSNMLSMPPFAGEQQSSFISLTDRAKDTYKNGTWKSASAMIPEIQNGLESVPDQAQLLWLSGVLKAAETDRADYGLFTRAKDFDLIPFRARSSLIDGLTGHFMNPEFSRGITLMNIADSLEKILGEKWSSDVVFLDHVHFNKLGQSLVSGLLARQINEKANLGVAGPALSAFYSVPEKVWASVNLTYFSEAEAYLSLERLLDDAPFKDMPIPYSRPTLDFFRADPLWTQSAMKSAVLSGDDMEIKKTYLNWLNENNVPEGIMAEAWSDIQKNPADPEYYKNWVFLAVQTEYEDDPILQVWNRGWLLTGKSSEYKQSFLRKLEEKSRLALAERVRGL